MFPIFVGIALIVMLCMVAFCIFTGFVIVQATQRAAQAGSAWIAKRQEQGRHLTALAQAPETSLLRAGEMPTAPADVLVRPVAETPIGDTEELLRASQE